ncbi:hypothetical protein CTAYLR_002817 [Chrysophaeum taylorii]|uniref:Adenylosuccinate synthetase n=1 Tax=Chrysophaeum taylorii TaxID=2483200 RepID=A0AAD7U7Y9_9STRA|nr:hypothetical protein CTAYLR_002817 [Chrysophaeum taylorii]
MKELSLAVLGGAAAAAVWWAVLLMRRRREKDVTGRRAQVCVVLGAQWGDEGKGKLVDVLASDVDIVARFNGGANAGHTLEVDGKKFAFHLLPCGMLHKRCLNVIGNGVVAHLPTMFDELEELGDPEALGRLAISTRAHVVLDSHREIDGMLEAEKGGGALGTTKRGIGPCYASKANRNGIRFADLKDGSVGEKVRAIRAFQAKHYPGVSEENVSRIESYAARLVAAGAIRDTVALIHEALDRGDKILAEGANAALLDPDFGTYPFVTSSTTTAGGVCTGLGVPPRRVDCVLGVVKAYTTRVGAGPFPTELDLDDNGPGHHLSTVGREYGTTTGRKRRCGWLDAPLLRYSAAVNGYDSICLTKLDVLTGIPTLKIAVDYHLDAEKLPRVHFPASLDDLARVQVTYVELDGWHQDITGCTSFSQLPSQAQNYVRAIEHHADLAVSWVGVGPGRRDIFVMPGL